MTVSLCISDGGGMLFRGRRLTRDRVMIEDLSKIANSEAIFISDFSLSLFDSSEANVIAVSDPLLSAGKGDFVFIEDRIPFEYSDKISTMIIYKWNRRYPFDVSFDADPASLGMRLCESIDFAGKSHEKITRETWKRV